MSSFVIKTRTIGKYEVIVPDKVQNEVKKHLKNKELVGRFYKKTAETRKRAFVLWKTFKKSSFEYLGDLF